MSLFYGLIERFGHVHTATRSWNPAHVVLLCWASSLRVCPQAEDRRQAVRGAALSDRDGHGRQAPWRQRARPCCSHNRVLCLCVAVEVIFVENFTIERCGGLGSGHEQKRFFFNR